MRKWMILLLLVSTSAALSVGIYLLRNQVDEDIGESVELPEPAEYVAVFYGQKDGLEFLLRPFYGDDGEDEFQTEQLNRLLGDGVEYTFGRLWIVNHSARDVALDVGEESVLDFTWGQGNSGSSQSIKSLTQDKKELSRVAQMVFTTLGQVNKIQLAKRELVDLTVAMPSEVDLEFLDSVTQRERSILFRPASARRVDLLQYISQPRGYIEKILITREDQKENQEQASRKKEGQR